MDLRLRFIKFYRTHQNGLQQEDGRLALVQERLKKTQNSQCKLWAGWSVAAWTGPARTNDRNSLNLGDANRGLPPVHRRGRPIKPCLALKFQMPQRFLELQTSMMSVNLHLKRLASPLRFFATVAFHAAKY